MLIILTSTVLIIFFGFLSNILRFLTLVMDDIFYDTYIYNYICIFKIFVFFKTRQRSFIKYFQKEQMKKILILLILSVTTTLISQENIKYSETITSKDLYKHISVLASDSLEGRETGKKGQKMAADYIMNHFKDIGIPHTKTTDIIKNLE